MERKPYRKHMAMLAIFSFVAYACAAHALGEWESSRQREPAVAAATGAMRVAAAMVDAAHRPALHAPAKQPSRVAASPQRQGDVRRIQ